MASVQSPAKDSCLPGMHVAVIESCNFMRVDKASSVGVKDPNALFSCLKVASDSVLCMLLYVDTSICKSPSAVQYR